MSQQIPHKYIKRDLGHAHEVCEYCYGTPVENSMLGESNHCSARARKQKEEKEQS